MCGICGFITNRSVEKDNLIQMSRTLLHRGPDDHGEEIYELSDGRNIGFAQRRLSILDLSSNGHQPMHSKDNRISLVFNGEIYNYLELKACLGDYEFVTSCDTEVIIAAYLKWGKKFICKVDGMFSIALLDREKEEIYLYRDRIGKKPLYYYYKNGNFIFSSELKAILESELFEKEINKSIIGRFLYRGYICNPDTIFMHTYKMRPGSILTVKRTGICNEKYWDVAQVYSQQKAWLINDYNEALNGLREALYKSVNRRMISDVPLGAMLSGGFDSALICSIAQDISIRPLETFSIGFEEKDLNEAVYAREIANYLGTNHTEMYITPKDMLNMLDSIPYYYDEPFADNSEICTMLVSNLARKNVKVALTGDGGDELFGGYYIYEMLQKVQKIENGFDNMPDEGSLCYRILKEKCDLETETQAGASGYTSMVNKLLLSEVDNFYYEVESKYNEHRYEARRMLLDMETELPEGILTKVDRASMRYALECRCPFLSKDVIEYSFRLPIEFKIDSGNKKKIIKDLTYLYLPPKLMDRPKMSFGLPLDKWLRGELMERVLYWSDSNYLKNQGIFDPEGVSSFMNYYMENGDKGKFSGKNFSRIVWSYFVFQQWYDVWMKTKS